MPTDSSLCDSHSLRSSQVRVLGTDPELPPESINIKGAIKAGDNVREVGSDIAEDQEILPAGHVLNPTSIGVLAAFGIFLVRVHLQPTIGVFSIGDELVEIGEALHNRGQVRDCNKATLNAMLSQMRVACNDYGIVENNARLIEEKVRERSGGERIENTYFLFSIHSSQP